MPSGSDSYGNFIRLQSRPVRFRFDGRLKTA
jgi:hypothetical protein